MPDLFDLDTRAGWPEELNVLLRQYPREVWPTHVNLGNTAQFWLQIHEGFRDIGGELKEKTQHFREGLITPDEYRRWFAPRLRTMLTHLQGHHQIEDHHFFPLFAEAEARLKRGFEVLESDHDAIHEAVDVTVEHANAFLRAPDTDMDAMRRAADAYGQSHDALLHRLDRHLLDEEDLIIPIILDRGERKLGI